jgi:hypothetical protein
MFKRFQFGVPKKPSNSFVRGMANIDNLDQ